MITDSFADDDLSRGVGATMASPEQIERIAELGVQLDKNDTQMDRGARKYYDVASVEELDGKQAAEFIRRLTKAKKKRDEG